MLKNVIDLSLAEETSVGHVDNRELMVGDLQFNTTFEVIS